MKSFYKYLLLSIVFAALGLVPAYIFHKYEVLTIDERFYWDQWKQTDEGKTGPLLYTSGSLVVDFGVLDGSDTVTHEFIVENVGDKFLEIWSTPVPGRKVTIDLGEEKVEIPRGTSYPITLSLDASKVTEDLNETVTIESNDSRENEGTLRISVTAKRGE